MKIGAGFVDSIRTVMESSSYRSGSSGPLRPDEVIGPVPVSVQTRHLLRDVASLLPNVAKLLGRLLKDPRVPRRTKLVVGAAMAYAASPVDVVPDFVPVLGVADDVLLMCLVLNRLVESAGEEVVLEHWDGPRDLLDLVRAVIDVASDFVPAPIRRLVGRIAGS